jgi:hypothetical protein
MGMAGRVFCRASVAVNNSVCACMAATAPILAVPSMPMPYSSHACCCLSMPHGCVVHLCLPLFICAHAHHCSSVPCRHVDTPAMCM